MTDGSEVASPVLADSAATYTPGISERRGGTTKFYHGDNLGSTRGITNTSQTATDGILYDAFGRVVSRTGTTPTPFGFVGREQYQTHADSGLLLLGHRYYDPYTGRFITQDPIGELGSFDPTTGEGSVVVPNVTPGPWPVVATCVEPTLDVDQLEAGIRENGAFLESLNPPTCDINDPAFGEWVVEILGEGADVFLFLETFGPTFIQNIVVPDALGLQIFTVLATPPDVLIHRREIRALTKGKR